MTSAPERVWIHAIITLRGWWLPGDARGFRNRDHRIHSSGDYKKPPPPLEHVGLRRFNQGRAVRMEPLIAEERGRAGEKLVVKLTELGCTVLAVAVGKSHAHLLFSVASEQDAALPLGRAKQASSHAIGRRVGRLWAQGAGIDRVRDRPHQLTVFRYIIWHAREGAWVWNFRAPAPAPEPNPSLRPATPPGDGSQ